MLLLLVAGVRVTGVLLAGVSIGVVAGTNVMGALLAGVSRGAVRSAGGGGCRVWSLVVWAVYELLVVWFAGCWLAPWYLRVEPL